MACQITIKNSKLDTEEKMCHKSKKNQSQVNSMHLQPQQVSTLYSSPFSSKETFLSFTGTCYVLVYLTNQHQPVLVEEEFKQHTYFYLHFFISSRKSCISTLGTCYVLVNTSNQHQPVLGVEFNISIIYSISCIYLPSKELMTMAITTKSNVFFIVLWTTSY